MNKCLTNYTPADLVKLAVGAAPGLSSPAPWNSAANSLPKAPTPGSFGKALWNNGGKEVAHGLGTAAGHAGSLLGNTFGGIATTGIGAANAAAGTIGAIGGGIARTGTLATDGLGLTNGATQWVDHNINRHMGNAARAGVKDMFGGVADTLTGGLYDYDGAGSAVAHMREGMRDELGRGSAEDVAFRVANGVGDFAATTAATGGAGRGLNVLAKTMQGSQVAAPVLNAVAKAPVVGKPLATTGNWLAGPAPTTNMFQQGPAAYIKSTFGWGDPGRVGGALAPLGPAAQRVGGFVDNIGRVVWNGSDDVFRVGDTAADALYPPDQRMAPAAAAAGVAVAGAAPALTGPEATKPNPQGGPSLAQEPPVPAPAPALAPAPAPEPPPLPTEQPAYRDQNPGNSPTGPAGTADKAFAGVTTQLADETIPLPQRQELAKTTVQQHIDQNRELKQGLQDYQAGKTDTPAARTFQAEMDKYKNTMIYDEFEKLKQANPTANLSDPNTYAGFLSQAANTATTKFNEMPMEHQLLTGLGLGGGLIGILSSLFGGGGMAGGLLGLLGLAVGGGAAAAGGVFGNQAQAQTGRLMNDMASFFGGVNVPTAEQLGPAGEKQTLQNVQKAMNQSGANGRRAGWAAGQKVIDEQRAQADTLLKLPRQYAITSLMGLPGEGAPQTQEEAGALLDSIAQRHQEAGQAGFLRQRATAQARAMLREQDKAGWLAAMLKNRGTAGDGMNLVREGFVHSQFNKPENKMFLNPDGTLPAGATEDEFIDNMLRNAYGEYPEKGASMNIAQQIFLKQAVQKAARCWAGYEPVPGKAPYSNDSCRPKNSKKPKAKKKPVLEKQAVNPPALPATPKMPGPSASTGVPDEFRAARGLPSTPAPVAAPAARQPAAAPRPVAPAPAPAPRPAAPAPAPAAGAKYSGPYSKTPFDIVHARQHLGLPDTASAHQAYNRMMYMHRNNKFTPAQFSAFNSFYGNHPPQFDDFSPKGEPHFEPATHPPK